jgi:hypothetical protein
MSTAPPAASEPTGYLHEDYARSFGEAAAARRLPGAGAWILERVIPGTTARDAMGCYPVFACRDWSRLPDDLSDLSPTLVAVSLVTDPFGPVAPGFLRQTFDVVRFYKDHFVTDLRPEACRTLPRGHRRNVRRAVRRVRVEVCDAPGSMVEPWTALYARLCERRQITGLRAFSSPGFRLQLAVPGLVMFVARAAEAVVGIHLWYQQGACAYGHLGATSDEGNALGASYALYDSALEYFAGRVAWLDLGSTPGLPDVAAGAGLRRFKAGWSTGVRPVFLCGRILQPEVYRSLTAATGYASSDCFPAYRTAEFSVPAAAASSSGSAPHV